MTRVSRIMDDAGFTECRRCRVFLAGVEVNNVLTADEEKRYAETYRKDVHGLCVFDKNGEAVTDEFYGDVAVICPCKGQQTRSEQVPCAPKKPDRPLFPV
jgi:hypothetical protein